MASVDWKVQPERFRHKRVAKRRCSAAKAPTVATTVAPAVPWKTTFSISYADDKPQELDFRQFWQLRLGVRSQVTWRKHGTKETYGFRFSGLVQTQRQPAAQAGNRWHPRCCLQSPELWFLRVDPDSREYTGILDLRYTARKMLSTRTKWHAGRLGAEKGPTSSRRNDVWKYPARSRPNKP